jgi:hypothetical protein
MGSRTPETTACELYILSQSEMPFRLEPKVSRKSGSGHHRRLDNPGAPVALRGVVADDRNRDTKPDPRS